ncbi:MAG: hypothetical protein MJ239_06565 [Bacilli bacterium]|nr:hypothetical protein [Bacilli bacterium]
MKKSLLALIPASLFALSSCSFLENLPHDSGEEGDESYSQVEYETPSIEKLNKKYSGFEVTYIDIEGATVKVGGQGNIYWYAVFSEDTEEGTLYVANSTTTTVEGSSFKNEYYSAGTKWTSDDTENNMAATLADTKFIGAFQYGGILEDMPYTSVTLEGEPARKYRVSIVDVFVSVTYGITMQADYDGGDSLKFVGIKKGNDAQPVVVEAE